MKSSSIAALLTCHNRKQKTLTCLEALFDQKLSAEVDLHIYLVDDGSTDGTAEAVRQAYPQVRILQGSGNLFWNGGMRQAFAEAIKDDRDYYLWLNDDTLLYPEALDNFLTTSRRLSEQGDIRAIVVGSTQDSETGKLTYGGRVRSSWWHPLKFRLVEPGTTPKPCETMNGNCVLIPRAVVQVVGNLEPAFTHTAGDIDYGLRARKQGCSLWVAPGYVGTCQQNPLGEHWWEDPNLTLSERLKKMSQPKGLPLAEWKVVAQRHAGVFWPIYWLLPSVRLLLLSVFGSFRGNRA
jgi:GT2 family glycosyltransferase